MDLFLNPDGHRITTRELFEQLREGIVSGRLAEGDRLPPTREAAAQLGVARTTVTTVYGRLAAEGFIEGRAGAGSFVAAVATRERPARPAALQPTSLAVSPEVWDRTPLDPSPYRYDCRSGVPDPALFPLVAWRQSLTTAHQSVPVGYGDPAGIEPLRRTLAHWIGTSRAVEARADQVVVTSGAQHAIDLVVRLLVRPGEVVAVEDPGYPAVRRLCAVSGAVVAPVPVDREGIVVDAIPASARVVYTTPSHQSPTGVTMSLARRRELLRFAEEHDVAVIEDDYDSEYRHVDRPLEPLYRLDRSGRVVYVGTFSKTLAPALRLGFAVLPDSLVDAARNLCSLMGSPPGGIQEAMQRFIADGHHDRHLRRTRRVYSDRHDLVRTFLTDAVAAGLLVGDTPGNAGLHVAPELPPGVGESEVRAAARARGVALGSFGECWVGPTTRTGVVIGFGAVASDELPAALALTGEALAQAGRLR